MLTTRRFCGWMLLGLALVCGGALAAQVPIADFVKHPPLGNPVISPTGQYLAVVVPQNDNTTDYRAQVAVLRLPDLKPVSRMDMTPLLRPLQIIWTSNTRLAVAMAKDAGPLEMIPAIVKIVAVNFDGSGARPIYSLLQQGAVSNGDALAGNGTMGLPAGVPIVMGTTPALNGHLLVTIDRFADNSIGDLWHRAQSTLYDVDTRTGHATQMGTINHGDMTLWSFHGIARIASGEDPQQNPAIFTSSDGKAWTRLSSKVTGAAFEPLAISRDGAHFYALQSPDGGPDRLVQCPLDGSACTVLASDAFSSANDVMWNPVTGTPIAAMFEAGGRPLIKFIGTGKYARIMHTLAENVPGGMVALLGGSADGSTLLITASSDHDPGLVATYEVATQRVHPLYHVLPWIDPNAMPERLPIRFKDRAGLEIAGFLTLPNGVAPKNLPLVLMPHGGPIDVADTWFFDPWAALLANRGYAVLQINYRGSSERGLRFENAGYRQFASGMQDDLIDGVRWAMAQGYVDPQRICVFGASFGGYAALMQPILAPRLYKCAIDYAGVYDWRIAIQDGDQSDNAYSKRYFAQAIGTLNDAYAISPASMLDKLGVPVLIAHGEDDPRAPFKNATELRAALQKAGKPYEWLAEPGERHGFTSVAHNEQLFTMVTAFLAKYIGPGVQAPATPPPAAK